MASRGCSAALHSYIVEKVTQGELNRKLVTDTAQLYERVYEARTNNAAEKAAVASQVMAESRLLLDEVRAVWGCSTRVWY